MLPGIPIWLIAAAWILDRASDKTQHHVLHVEHELPPADPKYWTRKILAELNES